MTIELAHNEVGLTQEVYPSGRTVTLGYDGAGRVSSIAGTKSYTSSAIQYTAHGDITRLPLAGIALTEQRCYNSRLQPFAIRLGSASESGGTSKVEVNTLTLRPKEN